MTPLNDTEPFDPHATTLSRRGLLRRSVTGLTGLGLASLLVACNDDDDDDETDGPTGIEDVDDETDEDPGGGGELDDGAGDDEIEGNGS